MDPIKVDKFDFGKLEYYSCYVIGTINANVKLEAEVAKSIINSTKNHFGKQKFVYISNREFGYQVDASVYKFVDPKRMIAIALVSKDRDELVKSAGPEQASYSGSFGVFNTLDSAISWARSFVEEEELEDN